MKTIKGQDEQQWTIRDDGAPTHYVDWLVEAWQHGGVIAISLGSGTADQGSREVQVPIRWRANLAHTKYIRDTLTRLINEVEGSQKSPPVNLK